MSENPYAAPQTVVTDAVEQRSDGDFREDPRAVPAGNGWQWIVSAWTLFKQAPAMWMVVVLIVMGISMVLGMVPFLGSLAQNVAWPFMFGAIALFADDVYKGRTADVAVFGSVTAHTAPLLVLGLIYLGGIVTLLVVAFVPLLGFSGLSLFTGSSPELALDKRVWIGFLIYFVLAIPFMMATYFAPTLVVLQGKAPLDALRLSLRAGLRNILPMIVFMLGLMGLGLVATLPLLLGWFVLIPVMFATGYATYRDIFFD